VPYGKGCLLLLTPQEIPAGIRRAKWWKWRQPESKREADAVTLKTPRAPEGSTLAVPAYRKRR